VWYVLALLLASCAIIEGPCRIDGRQVECQETGKVVLIAPAVTLDAAGGAAYQANPVRDPMLLVPPRDRR